MPQMTFRRMRIAWWIPNATNTHSEYVEGICRSIAKVVAGRPLSFSLFVHCLSC